MKRIIMVVLISLLFVPAVYCDFATGVLFGAVIGAGAASNSNDQPGPSVSLPLIVNDNWLYMGFVIDGISTCFVFYHRQLCEFFFIHNKSMKKYRFRTYDKKYEKYYDAECDECKTVYEFAGKNLYYDRSVLVDFCKEDGWFVSDTKFVCPRCMEKFKEAKR